MNIDLLTKICKPGVSICAAFAVNCRHVEWQQIWVLEHACSSLRLSQGYVLLFCFNSWCPLNRCPFRDTSGTTFFTFCAFSWRFQFSVASNCSAKCCLVAKQGSLLCSLGGKAWVVVLPAVNSVFVTQTVYTK